MIRVGLARTEPHYRDFDQIRAVAGLDELVRLYDETLQRELQIVDIRREAVVFQDRIIIDRRRLPGDPAGYRAVDLGERSFFTDSGLDPVRFRGADYDPAFTVDHQRDGRNAYLLSETVLSADLGAAPCAPLRGASNQLNFS